MIAGQIVELQKQLDVAYVRDKGILGATFKHFLAGLPDSVRLVLLLEFPDVH